MPQRLAWVKVYGNSFIQELCGQKNGGPPVTKYGVGMRVIATFFARTLLMH